MKRSIFFLYYRGGSSLFEVSIGKAWRKAQVRGESKQAHDIYNQFAMSNANFYLPTQEPVICGDHNTIEVELSSDFPDITWTIHVGDWWGQKSSDQVPEPYSFDYCPSRWSWKEIRLLPKADWSFAALIRDGRNQIESLRRFKGGIEEDLQAQNPDDYFKVLCKGFRNRARVALDCSRLIDRYKIFKAEDLFADKVETMQKIFQHVGYELDSKSVVKHLEDIDGEPAYHSSFKTKSFNERWHSWTQEEVAIFKSIAGQELIELGYEANNDWNIP